MEQKKVGRNDPCPCGSGKKYKNCHLLQENQKKTYTPTGKRKFKAKVLSTGGDKSREVVQQTIKMPTLAETPAENLRVKMTERDFRTGPTTKKAKEGGFVPPPVVSAPESFESPPPLPPEQFKPTRKDYREKTGE